MGVEPPSRSMLDKQQREQRGFIGKMHVARSHRFAPQIDFGGAGGRRIRGGRMVFVRAGGTHTRAESPFFPSWPAEGGDVRGGCACRPAREAQLERSSEASGISTHHVSDDTVPSDGTSCGVQAFGG